MLAPSMLSKALHINYLYPRDSKARLLLHSAIFGKENKESKHFSPPASFQESDADSLPNIYSYNRTNEQQPNLESDESNNCNPIITDQKSGDSGSECSNNDYNEHDSEAAFGGHSFALSWRPNDATSDCSVSNHKLLYITENMLSTHYEQTSNDIPAKKLKSIKGNKGKKNKRKNKRSASKPWKRAEKRIKNNLPTLDIPICDDTNLSMKSALIQNDLKTSIKPDCPFMTIHKYDVIGKKRNSLTTKDISNRKHDKNAEIKNDGLCVLPSKSCILPQMGNGSQEVAERSHTAHSALTFVPMTTKCEPKPFNSSDNFKKIVKIYLSEKQSECMKVGGMMIPCAPPATPTADQLRRVEYVPSMNDIRSQRAVISKLKVLRTAAIKKSEKLKEDQARNDKQKLKEKEREWKRRQRQEIYALNKMMTDFEHQNFMEYCQRSGIPGV